MTRASFYKTSLEEKHVEELQSINRMISETIQLTSTDFLRICNELLAQNGQGNAEHVSQAVKELQFSDALTQKLEHVLAFLKSILSGESIENEDGEMVEIRNVMGCVFRLNYLQVIATHDDFTRVVQKVKGLMRKFKSFDDTKTAFIHLSQISNNFESIISTLSVLSEEFVSSSDFDISEITDYFSDRYSMMSERLVLNWCVSSEFESIEEFRQYYALHETQGSVELF